MTGLERLKAFWIKFAFAIVLAHALTPHAHASALSEDVTIQVPVDENNWLQEFFDFNVGEEHLEHMREAQFSFNDLLCVPISPDHPKIPSVASFDPKGSPLQDQHLRSLLLTTSLSQRGPPAIV